MTSGRVVLPSLCAALVLAAPALAAPAHDPIASKCAGLGTKDCKAATTAAAKRPVPAFVLDIEPEPDDTLANAIDAAWRSAPTVQQQRYRVRMADDDYALALSETRPNANVTVTGLYTKTVPGQTTQATRFLAASPIITSNSQTSVATLNQPLLTGGKARADREAALAEVGAGRETLRGTEGTLVLNVMSAYADIRRDTQTVRFYTANLRQMEATFEEVKARQIAGELTRTDIGLAETQLASTEAARNTAIQQLEQDRANFAALVGRDPGVLAEPPPLPGIPATINDAFDFAEVNNPDLAAALSTERQSRAQIESARAAGRPTLMLSGSAALTGQGTPFYLKDQDQTFQGQAVLTVPLFTGGAVQAHVAQAEDQNGYDRFGIEATRRSMVESIVNAWNAMATTQRNVLAAERQVKTARVFDEGTFAEYRAGLRSTFDVIYAHSTRLGAEIALVSARHDLFVAQAAILRQLGLLEPRTLLQAGVLDDLVTYSRQAEKRGSTPGDALFRALDSLQGEPVKQQPLTQPAQSVTPPTMLPATPPAPGPLPIAGHSPETPVPGTTGAPVPDRSLARP
jgi:outer membrane protein